MLLKKYVIFMYPSIGIIWTFPVLFHTESLLQQNLILTSFQQQSISIGQARQSTANHVSCGLSYPIKLVL